ncbi:MAG TPA: DNA-directed DNA polymerase II small subunit [Candidatus Norongarragalinales archaeon]|nr:DNA-directed DNA polymerase II small subunit [Candidatus Norongarragalinales archaeon]
MNARDYALQKKLLLEAGVLNKIGGRNDASELLRKMEEKTSARKALVITNSVADEVLAEENIQKTMHQPLEKIPVEKPFGSEIAKGFVPSLKILSSKKYECYGTVEDFVLHFNSRLEKIGRILKNRASENGITTIDKAKAALDKRRTRVIGIVDSKGIAKSGNAKFVLEDETGVVTCIATQGKPVFTQASRLWLDEVVGVDGFYSNNGLFIAENVVWPDVPIRQKKLADVKEDASIAFMSDLHVGSRYFLKDNFEKALAFFNGAGTDEERKIAEKIRYLVIAGDVVDGIGVYPGQEKQLVTKDVYEQYKLLGEYLKSIPEHIQVIISPGNHDAVRDAEPQPPLLGEFVESFEEPNFHFVPNPCYLDIHGIKILIYHGTSADALISNSEGLGDAFEHTEKIAVEMLRRRHLSPLYGEKPMIPSREDGMVVDEIPDIFHFGHLHRNCLYEYNGTVIINSGTWQSMTDYEEKMGRKPTPCLLPVYNIRAGSAKILDFNERE